MINKSNSLSENSISVIIPTYNRFHAPLAAIQSVLQQTHQAQEIILIDDGSSPTVQYFLEMNLPKGVVLLQQKHQGVSAARNIGVAHSSSSWICFLDSDDIWHKNKLALQLQYHEKNKDIKISQTQEIWIRDKIRVNPHKIHEKKQGDIFNESLLRCAITPSCVMLHKSIWEQTNGFDILLPACEDYDLWLQLTAQLPVGLLPNIGLTRFGGHVDQLSSTFPVMDRFRIYSLLKLLRSKILSEQQTSLTQNILTFKQNLFIQGKKKRNQNTQEIEKFFSLAYKLDQTDFQEQARFILLESNIVT